MSSTSGRGPEKHDTAESMRLIRAFLDKELMPVASRLAGAKKAPFPAGPEASRLTYWVKRTHTSMTPSDFEVPGTASIDEFEPALAKMWTQQGWPELAPLAPSLAKIARAVYFTEDRDDEVSPFMYVMF